MLSKSTDHQHLELSWCPVLILHLARAYLMSCGPSSDLYHRVAPWLLPLKLLQDNHIVLLLKLGSVTLYCCPIYAIMNLLRTLPRLQSFIIITTTTHSAAAAQTCKQCLTMLEKKALFLLKVPTIAFTLSLRIINRDPENQSLFPLFRWPLMNDSVKIDSKSVKRLFGPLYQETAPVGSRPLLQKLHFPFWT